VDAPSRVVRCARRWTGRPTVVAGLGFAFAGRRGRNPLRYSLPGVIVGIAGLLGALTFASTLDRLAATPSRYGWNGDFNVVDVNDEMLAELASDPRLEAVTFVQSKSVVAEGQTLQAYSHTDVRGTTGWTIVEGHAPRGTGEVVLTAQSARRIHVDLGDLVMAMDADGAPVELVVTGLGLGPNSSNERLDELVLLHADDMARLGTSQAFTEALVRVADGEDVDAIMATYANRFELGFRTMPADVANIVELGQLPEALGAFLAVIAVVALIHMLAVTTSRHARDLAVLRSLGLTRGEVRRVVATAAVAITTVGLLVGVPLGFAIGRLVWWSVAHSIGTATDASYELLPLVVLVPVVLVAAVLVAWWPARRATRPGVVAALRPE
jgi:putative ABC transport system permease protein